MSTPTPNELQWFLSSDESSFEALKVEIAVQIEKALDENNFSRSDLAKLTNRSRSWVTKVMSGDSNLTLETLCLLAGALKKEILVEFVDAEPLKTIPIKYEYSFKNKRHDSLKTITPKLLDTVDTVFEMHCHE
ncbi:helix-turn-helix domain-containing protein [Paenalcaligenes suwonensis]|uniref:helix-turn-helix domain-containing protein n=1 Tax=Paenalcaligenes suwonensis TaxID=1202713 RepID=UPI00140BC302|nr:helix-turn-helix transcriptional regulator [Paenalcaligenes suwonensis]NHC62204.1 helix-turn-helix transcriptional regulator [Paenalcaligenes suwonensis]